MVEADVMAARSYNKTKRLTKEQETHRKIMDAALSLYGSVGPAATTISAVADNASVQRLTIYRHFPQETGLMDEAITTWFAENPLPDPPEWRDGVARDNWPIAILSMLYSYFSDASDVLPGLLNDRSKLSHLDDLLSSFDQQINVMYSDILGCQSANRQTSDLVQSVVRHAVTFSTWQSLSHNNLDTVEIAALMEDWVQRCPHG